MGRRTKRELNSSRMTIDEIWGDFKVWRGEYRQQRFAGLMLHYSPIAKYLAFRLAPFDDGGRLLMPTALIALARAIEEWPQNNEVGFKDFAMVRMREACLARIRQIEELPGRDDHAAQASDDHDDHDDHDHDELNDNDLEYLDRIWYYI